MSRFSVTVSRSIGMVLGPLSTAYAEIAAFVAVRPNRLRLCPRASRSSGIRPIPMCDPGAALFLDCPIRRE